MLVLINSKFDRVIEYLLGKVVFEIEAMFLDRYPIDTDCATRLFKVFMFIILFIFLLLFTEYDATTHQ